MDYQQHWYGRPSSDPAREPGQTARDGGSGAVAMVVGVIVAAFVVAVWLAGPRDRADMPSAPDANIPAAAPALPTDSVPPAATTQLGN